MSHMYRRAWRAGLKTTYYLRTLGASTIEKTTVTARGGRGLLDRGDAQRRGVRSLPMTHRWPGGRRTSRIEARSSSRPWSTRAGEPGSRRGVVHRAADAASHRALAASGLSIGVLPALACPPEAGVRHAVAVPAPAATPYRGTRSGRLTPAFWIASVDVFTAMVHNATLAVATRA